MTPSDAPSSSLSPSRLSDAHTSWFRDEDQLLGELRRTRGGGPFSIAGYDELRELKRGGQGVVYRAVQRSTKREVAIKVLLDSAYYSPSGQQRFAREVDLAASLRHPGIVRVYDSGRTSEGRAFLVMEFAEGLALDEYSKQAKSPRAILNTFVQVCDALQYAHTRGVIHRDIKPSNVRVDGEGTPRVLDFGLAKASSWEGIPPVVADAPSTRASPDHASLTTTGQFVGSLPWASPEQARGEHDSVDTRSDVYALGVVLFQLLTQRFPYDVDGPLHIALTNIATTLPKQLRSLRPDLDEQLETIIAKALAKDPKDRYQSVGDLADDIRHHLAGEPIRARRESAWRGLQRSAKRNRLIIGASLVTIFALALATFVSIRSAREARAQRDIARLQSDLAKQQSQLATQESARALREKQTAEATVSFLSSILSGASTVSGTGPEAKVIDVVDSAAFKLDATYADKPRTLAELHTTLANIYLSLDNLEKAKVHQTRAWEVIMPIMSTLPKDDVSPYVIRSSLATLNLYEGKFAEASKQLAAAIEAYKAAGFTNDISLSNTYSVLGVSLRRQGLNDEAIQAYEAGIDAMPPASPDDIDALGRRANFINNIASVNHSKGNLEKARLGYLEAIRMYTQTRGEDYSEVLTSSSNLAVLYLDQGKFQDALEVLVPMREKAERVYGREARNFFIVLNNIANAHEQLGQLDKATPIYEEVVRRYRDAGKADKPEFISPLSNLAGVYTKSNRFEEGIAAAQEAFDLATKIHGSRHSATILAQQTLGVCYSKAGRVGEALASLEPAFLIATGPDSPITQAWRRPLIQTSYAYALAQANRSDEALRLQDEALSASLRDFGTTHFASLRIMEQSAAILDLAGKPDEATAMRAKWEAAKLAAKAPM